MIQAWFLAFGSVGLGFILCAWHWDGNKPDHWYRADGLLQGLMFGVLWVGLLWMIASRLGIAP